MQATASEFTIENSFQSNTSSPVRWILSHVRRHWFFLGGVFIGALGNALLASAIPLYIGRAFNAIETGISPREAIVAGSIGIIVTQFIRSVLQFGRNFSSETLAQRLSRDAREELYINLLGKSMTFHDFQPVGDIMARATNDVQELNFMFNPGVNLVIGSMNFMVMPFIFVPAYSWKLLLAPTFFVLAYGLALKWYLARLQPIADNVRNSFGVLNGRLAEAIDGIETVKGAAQEDQEIGRFRKNAIAVRDAYVVQGKVEARFIPLLLLGVANAIGFTHAIYLFRQGEIMIGDVVAYMGILALFGFPTFVAIFAYSRLALGMAGARRILELMDIESDLDENTVGHEADIEGRVEFRDISFSYVDDKQVLQDISFTVEPGQTVAIVGQTGSGKSTIAKLVNRTYDVNEGTVLIDGVNVADWQLASLRQQISIIEQDIFLFSRSIADNIAFGNPEATREMVLEAAKEAQADEFITQFKDGYDTIIGERGVTLSGGQRQRLALARAFLARPHILILDDSTSAVDSATEDKIQQAIARAAANQTTILITHRLSQIRWADKIVLLRGGRLVAVGNHDELLESYDGYRKIFQSYE